MIIKNDMGRIKFYTEATKAGMPFICINEGEFQNVVMLIDTGSTDNILFGNVYQQVCMQLKDVEGEYTLFGIDGKLQSKKRVVGHMPFCGRKYEMSFLIQDNNDAGKMLSENLGVTVIGIIGTLFMAEHDWIVDFGKQEVRIPDFDISIDDFRQLHK